MLLVCEKRMAGGRPRKDEEDQGTRHIRAFEDLANMIGWIHHFTNEKVANIIDPILRPEILDQYAEWKTKAERMARAEGQVFKPGKVPAPPGKKGKSKSESQTDQDQS